MLRTGSRISCCCLSGNALKIIAAVSMLADHVGFLFFPDIQWLRIVGRLAFPIFAFMIAEGCRYSRNRLRYFLWVFLLGVVCQVVYTIAGSDGRMNVLLTFSLSIALICLLQTAKERKKVIWWLLFGAAIAGCWLLLRTIWVDYGFWGVMTPVFASVFQVRRGSAQSRYDRHTIHVAALGVGLAMLAYALGDIQIYGLLAIPVLLLYSGQRGKWKLKYFFYLFYPLHLAALQVIAWLLT
jgi:hypothetical protein